MLLNTKFFAAVFLLFSISTAAYTQDIDWYSKAVRMASRADSASLKKTFDSLTFTQESGQHKAEAMVHIKLALIRLKGEREYTLASEHLVNALRIVDQYNLLEEQFLTYLAIAQLDAETGAYQYSKEALLQAGNLPIKNQPLDAQVLLKNELARICILNGDLDEALKNLSEVLVEKNNLADRSFEADALHQLGKLLSIKGNLQEALEKFKEEREVRQSILDEKGEAQLLNDIGELCYRMKNDSRAMQNHQLALKMRRALGDQKDIAESFNNIGILYFEQKEFNKAIENLEQALIYSREANANEHQRKSLEYLSACYKAKGNFQTALKYKDDFSNITELIQREKVESEVLAKQTQFEINNKQEKILEKENEIRQKEERERQLLILIGLSAVIVVLIFFLYVSNKRANRKLKIINEKVNQQNVQLQELNATKDKFFSIISHDLKGPLNSLTSFSGLLINHTDSLTKEEIQLLAKDLDKSLKNLFALLENLLEWSRSQTGNIEFKPESFNLGELLEMNRQLLDTQAKTKNITIENQNQSALPVNVHKHSVNTVIRNLISNAIKFTPNGGKIILSAQAKNNELQISIADTGVGMSKAVMEKLFRIDTKITTKGTADEKGTGLGLILCKDFIEKNGGRIWVESEQGKGSVFHFTLPLVHASKTVMV